MTSGGRQRDKVASLVSELGSTRNGVLHIGDYSITALVERYGTPMFVYSGDLIERHCQRIQRSLGEDIDLYFSLKANPSLGVGQILSSLGIGAEVASGGELMLAAAAGFPAARTLFAGPGKTHEELRLSLEHGIGAIHVESPGELERVCKLARALDKQARVGLRVNPNATHSGASMRMGGGAQQFGIPEEDIPALVRAFRGEGAVRIVGLHVYSGTQAFDVAPIISAARATMELAASVSAELEQPLELVDVGGGFGVPYFEGTEEIDLDELGAAFSNLAAEWRSHLAVGAARMVVELGRYLVAAGGVYVTRVVDVKSVRGRSYAVTDGGMNHQTPATGNFGQVFRKPYPMAVLNRLAAVPDDPVCIVGPCCTPLDVLGTDLDLPAVAVGDLIGVFYSGAYGYSASSLAFLSHPTPAEVLVYRGRDHPLRDAGRMDQVLAGQRGLDLWP